MRKAFLAVTLLFCAIGSATAGFSGRDFDATYYFPNTSTPYDFALFTPQSFTVDAGIETVGDVEGVTFISVDFDDATLTITLNTSLSSPTWNAASFNGIIFNLLSSGTLNFSSATIDGSTNMSGFDASRVTFTDSSLGINWNGLSYIDGTLIKVNFDILSVPEPGTLVLVGLGLAGLGFGRRRKV